MISDNNLTYRSKDFTISISTDEYILRFRDADRFIKCCEECHNYARSWVCPPFSGDLEQELRNYRNLLFVVTKIIPDRSGIPLKESQLLIIPERNRIEQRLLEMESIYGGRAFFCSGKCLFCPGAKCARQEGFPCRHPEKARPSLEAYGFDIGRTTYELLGIELLWGKKGAIPDYLTVVCGFFYNSDDVCF